ncbi:hypothetical protein [Anaerosporobacter sp.]|uniref:hypothetical protein n=1 Tax=Anaerosporobacter sp. TaxID=1872529 RepID=UPI00286F91D7|nr:hypothetical protein [Anaerosporobacter sp.]
MYRKLNIPLKGNHYSYGKSDLFAIIIAFRYLLSGKQVLAFKEDFQRISIDFAKQSTEEKKYKLLSAMGIPENWFNSI